MSTTWAIRSTCELSKDILVEMFWTQRCKVNIEIPHGWTIFLYHVGSSCEYRSIVEGGLIAGGNQQSKRKASLLLYSYRSDERADVDSTFRRKRITKDSIQNELEKFTKYSTSVRSSNCSRQRIGILSVKEQCDIIVQHYASRKFGESGQKKQR